MYVRAFYFTVMTLTSVGYGAEAHTGEELICIMVIEMISVFYFPLLSAQIVSLMIEITRHISDFTQEKVENFDRWVLCLSRAPTPQVLPREIAMEIANYMDSELQHGLNYYLLQYPFFDQLTP